MRDWLSRIGVKTLYIEPGSPWEKGYNESFNGKLRNELLNGVQKPIRQDKHLISYAESKTALGRPMIDMRSFLPTSVSMCHKPSQSAPLIQKTLRKREALEQYETARRMRSRIGGVFRYAVASGLAETDSTGELRKARWNEFDLADRV